MLGFGENQRQFDQSMLFDRERFDFTKWVEQRRIQLQAQGMSETQARWQAEHEARGEQNRRSNILQLLSMLGLDGLTEEQLKFWLKKFGFDDMPGQETPTGTPTPSDPNGGGGGGVRDPYDPNNNTGRDPVEE